MKGRILKAIEQQNQLGLILNLRGYYLTSKGWKSAVHHSEEEDTQPTEAQCKIWATAARINQFWKVNHWRMIKLYVKAC